MKNSKSEVLLIEMLFLEFKESKNNHFKQDLTGVFHFKCPGEDSNLHAKSN